MYREIMREIGDYIFVEDEPKEAEIILIPGNGYPQMAEQAARLYRDGYAPVVLPSGKYSVTLGKFGGVLSESEKYTRDYSTEWEFLCDVLVHGGVKKEDILKEDHATFTWENARFSREVTDNAGLEIKRAILCCKNHHARRALMYYERAYPETEFLVCPSCVDGIQKENWMDTEQGIDSVMGEMTRIIRQFSLFMGLKK